jgi:hypothetical protein
MSVASWSRGFGAGWGGARADRNRAPSTKRASRTRSFLPRLEILEGRVVPSITNVNTDTEPGYTTPHNETTIAVNPTNSQNLVGSANDYQATFDASGRLVGTTQYARAHVTFDGGQTWTDYEVPFDKHKYTNTPDPAVAFDADGTAYLATLGQLELPDGDITSPDLLVAHSRDGGTKWSKPELVAAGAGTESGEGIANDKEYIAAWGHGNAIVTWARFQDGPGGSYINSPIVASVTHDGGKTWTAPVQISGPLVKTQVAVPVVAADGSIWVGFDSWDTAVAPDFRSHFEAVKVDPGTGQALTAPIEISLVHDGAYDYPINVKGYDTLQDSQLRVPFFIGNLATDPTDARHLAAVWHDMRNNPYPDGLLPSSDPYQVRTNSDVIVSESTDGGLTWSAPVALTRPNDQFQPWAVYDADGRLQIGFYDRSYDPANHKYGYTLASEKRPGSLRFTFKQVTTALSDPTQGYAYDPVTVNPSFPNATYFIGDYSNIAISPDGVAAMWTDMRLPANDPPPFIGSGLDAFFAFVRTANDDEAPTAYSVRMSAAVGNGVDQVGRTLVLPARLSTWLAAAVGSEGLVGSYGLGAGLFLEDTTATITNSTVRHNTATGGSGVPRGVGAGGGLYIDDSLVSVEGLVVSDNHASTSDDDVFGSFAT